MHISIFFTALCCLFSNFRVSGSFIKGSRPFSPPDTHIALRQLDKDALSSVVSVFHDSIISSMSKTAKEYANLESVASDVYEFVQTGKLPSEIVGHSRIPELQETLFPSDIPNAYGFKSTLASRNEFHSSQDDQTACERKVVAVVTDIVSLVLSFVGLRNDIAEGIAREFVDGLEGDIFEAVHSAIEKIASAESAVEKAEEVYKIFVQIYKAVGGLSAIKRVLAIALNMKWYDWIIAVVSVSAQLAAMFGTAGADFIAQASKFVESLVKLTKDSEDMKKQCGMSDTKASKIRAEA